MWDASQCRRYRWCSLARMTAAYRTDVATQPDCNACSINLKISTACSMGPSPAEAAARSGMLGEEKGSADNEVLQARSCPRAMCLKKLGPSSIQGV